MILFLTLLFEFVTMHFLKLESGYASTALSAVMIVVACVALLCDVKRKKSISYAFIPIFVGTVFRLILLLIDVYGKSIITLPNGSSDSEMFYEETLKYIKIGVSERGLFPIIMGNLFKITGISKLYGQFILMLISLVCVVLLALILNRLEINKEIRFKVILIASLLPNFSILSVLFLRETIEYLFITFSFYLYISWITKKREMLFLFACIVALLGATIHSGLIALVVGYFAVRLLYDKKTSSIKIRPLNIIVTILLVMVTTYFVLQYADVFIVKLSKVDDISDIANTRDVAGSSYVQYVGDSSSVRNMLIYTIPRAFYFLFSPLPWQWRGFSDVFAFFFSSLLYFYCILFTFSRFKSLSKRDKCFVVLISVITFVVVFVFSWGVTNSGTALRHREKTIMLFLTLYAISSGGSKKYRMQNEELC